MTQYVLLRRNPRHNIDKTAVMCCATVDAEAEVSTELESAFAASIYQPRLILFHPSNSGC